VDSLTRRAAVRRTSGTMQTSARYRLLGGFAANTQDAALRWRTSRHLQPPGGTNAAPTNQPKTFD